MRPSSALRWMVRLRRTCHWIGHRQVGRLFKRHYSCGQGISWERVGSNLVLTSPDSVNSWAYASAGDSDSIAYELHPFQVTGASATNVLSLSVRYEGAPRASNSTNGRMGAAAEWEHAQFSNPFQVKPRTLRQLFSFFHYLLVVHQPRLSKGKECRSPAT